MRAPLILAIPFLFAACGGGIVAAAEKAADTACACADLACAKSAVADFNKVSIKAGDEKSALSADDKAKFDAAVAKMSKCRDDLK